MGPPDPRGSLTLRKAVELAWERSPEVRAAEAQARKAWEQREEASERVRLLGYIPAPGLNVRPEADACWVGLLMADASWQMAERDLKDKKESLAQQVAQAYYDVIIASQEVEKHRSQALLAERALVVARARYNAGMATRFDLAEPEARLIAAQKALAASQEAQSKAYIALNRLIGLPPEARPEPTDVPREFSPLVVHSLEAEVSRALDSSAALYKARKAVEMAQWKVDYPYATGQHLKYNLATADLEVAHGNLQLAQEQIKEKVRSTYQDIRALEEKIGAQEAQVKLAEEAARLAQIRFEAGAAIKLEVDKAEAALAEAKAQLQSLYCQHAKALAGWRYLTGRRSPLKLKSPL